MNDSTIVVVGAEGPVCEEALMALVDDPAGGEDTDDSVTDIDDTLALRCTC